MAGEKKTKYAIKDPATGQWVDTNTGEVVNDAYKQGYVQGNYKGQKEVLEFTPVENDIYSQEQSLMGEQQKAIGEQVKTAEEGIGLAQKAGEAGMLAARRNAAAQLASYRGLGEGGRGMALGRGAAAVAGTTQAKIAADTAQAVQEEKTSAAQARADAALAKQAFLDKQKQYNQEVADASADVKAIITENKGTIYTSDDDKKKMRAAAVQAMGLAVSPQAKQVYKNFIDSIDNGTFDAPGTIG